VVLQQHVFTAVCKEVVDIIKTVDAGSEWFHYGMKFMVETKTRDTTYGADV
jgi:hypothetical protein